MEKKNKLQIAVVRESEYCKDNTCKEKGDSTFLLIGTYTDLEKAYGAALIQLTDIAESSGRGVLEYTITPLYELEAEAGFGMTMLGPDTNFREHMLILFNHIPDEATDGQE